MVEGTSLRAFIIPVSFTLILVHVATFGLVSILMLMGVPEIRPIRVVTPRIAERFVLVALSLPLTQIIIRVV